MSDSPGPLGPSAAAFAAFAASFSAFLRAASSAFFCFFRAFFEISPSPDMATNTEVKSNLRCVGIHVKVARDIVIALFMPIYVISRFLLYVSCVKLCVSFFVVQFNSLNAPFAKHFGLAASKSEPSSPNRDNLPKSNNVRVALANAKVNDREWLESVFGDGVASNESEAVPSEFGQALGAPPISVQPPTDTKSLSPPASFLSGKKLGYSVDEWANLKERVKCIIVARDIRRPRRGISDTWLRTPPPPLPVPPSSSSPSPRAAMEGDVDTQPPSSQSRQRRYSGGAGDATSRTSSSRRWRRPQSTPLPQPASGPSYPTSRSSRAQTVAEALKGYDDAFDDMLSDKLSRGQPFEGTRHSPHPPKIEVDTMLIPP